MTEGIAGSAPGPSQAEYPALWPVPVKEKWGYVDRQGNRVIAPQFSLAGRFQDGRARVGVLNKGEMSTGVIDPSGHFVVKMASGIPGASRFFEGLAGKKDASGQYGLIDKSGQFVIPPKFVACSEFREGLCAVQAEIEVAQWGELSLWGYIDRGGAFVIPPQFHGVEQTLTDFQESADFSEGLATAVPGVHSGLPGRGWRRGYIDKTGQWVIPPQFWRAGSFKEGLAAVGVDGILGATGDMQLTACGFIGRDGKMAIPARYTNVEPFCDGLAPVEVGGWWQAMGYHRQTLTPPFSDRPLMTMPVEGRWGCIDRNGVERIAPQFPRPPHFCEGLAAVEVDGKHGYIDSSGEFVIPACFDCATDFANGLASVWVANDRQYYGENYRLIDRTGACVWPVGGSLEPAPVPLWWRMTHRGG